MSTTLLKSLNIGGVEVEIRLNQNEAENDPDLIKKFVYELVNFDND